jgi:PAS domain S-box-containing protein
MAIATLFPLIQRTVLGLDLPFSPVTFVVPLTFGAIVGLLLGRWQLRLYDERLALQQSLAQVQTLNANLQELFEVSPIALVLASYPNGNIRLVNRATTTHFGYRQEQVAGKSCLDIGLWANLNHRREVLETLAEEGSVEQFSSQANTAEGALRQVLIYSNIITFQGERSLLLALLDVTEQRALEQQLRQTEKLEMLGQLAGGIVHDINNMLSTIMGSSELLALTPARDTKESELRNNISSAADQCAHLTRLILDFSRKENRSESETLRLELAVECATSLLERALGPQHRLVAVPSSEVSWVRADGSQIQNALLNLGINARDAMAETGTITIATRQVELDAVACSRSRLPVAPGPFVEISVSDTGKGMTPEVQERLFEPFFTTKGPGKGTGLGLASVSNTLRSCGGTIAVESRLGEGSTFRLYIPLQRAIG